MRIKRALTAAALLIAAAPAAAQVLLLDANQTVPMATALDNPCTAEPESILFQGSTELLQRVWLLPDGNLRLQIAENTAMAGSSPATLLGPGTKYAFGGMTESDVEFEPVGLSVLKYKKVQGVADNFHAVLVLDFDPQSLKVELKYEAACDNGEV